MSVLNLDQITLRMEQLCDKKKSVRFGTNIYLDVGEVDSVLLKVPDELSEILFSWKVVTTVRPYSLNKFRQRRQLCQTSYSEWEAPFFIV